MSSRFEKFKMQKDSNVYAENFKKSSEKKSYDDGTWSIKVNPESKDKTATAVIRFLPSKDGSDIPYELIYSHFFQGDDGKWCIVDRCPRTFGEDCKICEKNGKLYNTGKDADKNLASRRKARKNYLFNILILKDSEHPENEGKVMPFKAGPAIFQIILDSMTSQFGEEPKRPFDLYSGHNLILRVRLDPTKNNLPQYDKSKFEDTATPVAKNDEDLKQIFDEMCDLKEFVMKGKKSEEEIERLARNAYSIVMPDEDIAGASRYAKEFASESSVHAGDSLPWDEEPAPSESDDAMDYFRKLAEQQ